MFSISLRETDNITINRCDAKSIAYVDALTYGSGNMILYKNNGFINISDSNFSMEMNASPIENTKGLTVFSLVENGDRTTIVNLENSSFSLNLNGDTPSNVSFWGGNSANENGYIFKTFEFNSVNCKYSTLKNGVATKLILNKAEITFNGFND